MKIISHIIIPNVYSLYLDTMQIYYKQSLFQTENVILHIFGRMIHNIQTTSAENISNQQILYLVEAYQAYWFHATALARWEHLTVIALLPFLKVTSNPWRLVSKPASTLMVANVRYFLSLISFWPTMTTSENRKTPTKRSSGTHLAEPLAKISLHDFFVICKYLSI